MKNVSVALYKKVGKSKHLTLPDNTVRQERPSSLEI
jgi:hypothetical protein